MFQVGEIIGRFEKKGFYLKGTSFTFKMCLLLLHLHHQFGINNGFCWENFEIFCQLPNFTSKNSMQYKCLIA